MNSAMGTVLQRICIVTTQSITYLLQMSTHVIYMHTRDVKHLFEQAELSWSFLFSYGRPLGSSSGPAARLRRAAKEGERVGGHPRTPGHGTASPGTPCCAIPRFVPFLKSEHHAAGREGGKKESGDTPEPSAMGLRPPAPPALVRKRGRMWPMGVHLSQGGLSSPLFLCRLRRHERRKEGIGGYPQPPTRGTKSPWTP